MKELERWQDNLLYVVATKFGITTEPSWRCFITPTGHYIKTLHGFAPHNVTEEFIRSTFVEPDYEFLKESYNLSKEEVDEIVEHVSSSERVDGCPTLEEMGCIRCNGNRPERYVVIPPVRPTEDCMKAFELWLDIFFMSHSEDGMLTVEVQDASQIGHYNPDDVDTDYIINRVRRYYSSGTLLEDKAERHIRYWWDRHSQNYIILILDENGYEIDSIYTGNKISLQSELQTAAKEYNTTDVKVWKPNVDWQGNPLNEEVEEFTETQKKFIEWICCKEGRYVCDIDNSTPERPIVNHDWDEQHFSYREAVESMLYGWLEAEIEHISNSNSGWFDYVFPLIKKLSEVFTQSDIKSKIQSYIVELIDTIRDYEEDPATRRQIIRDFNNLVEIQDPGSSTKINWR